jgi:hypothetical protein
MVFHSIDTVFLSVLKYILASCCSINDNKLSYTVYMQQHIYIYIYIYIYIQNPIFVIIHHIIA